VDYSWEKRMKKCLAANPLAIFDFGLSALTNLQDEDFYELVTERNASLRL
jgi:hypothetical protein